MRHGLNQCPDISGWPLEDGPGLPPGTAGPTSALPCVTMGIAPQRPPRRATIRDVARLAGTSTSTVSVAISGRGRVSEPTRRRVLAAADRLGWRPDRRASALRQFEPRLVGLVYEVEQSFQAHLLDAMYVAMGRAGLEMVLAGATRHH